MWLAGPLQLVPLEGAILHERWCRPWPTGRSASISLARTRPSEFSLLKTELGVTTELWCPRAGCDDSPNSVRFSCG